MVVMPVMGGVVRKEEEEEEAGEMEAVALVFAWPEA